MVVGDEVPPMIEALQFLALFATALFAGAALYINLVEHPARMRLPTAAAAAQWAPSYGRATWMQAPLALVGCASGLAVAWLGGGGAWLAAAGAIGAVVPFTFMAIMPTNRRLLESGRDLASAETRGLLERWARLHAVRSALSLVALALYLWLVVSG
jgi:hypothetical protein